MIANRDTGYRDELARLTPRLRRFARALVENHNGDAADDLVQSALVAALGQEQERRGIRLAVWLMGTVVSGHRRGLRVATADRQANVNASTGGAPGSAGAGRWEALRRAPSNGKDVLGDMPLESREVYLLVVLEELTYVQAAECLGMTLNAVISNLARAREHLSRREPDARMSARPRSVGGAVHSRPHLRVVK